MTLSVEITLIIGIPTLIFTLITVLKILQDWINQYFIQKIVYQYLSLSEYSLKLNGNNFSKSDFMKINNKNNLLSFSMQEILRRTVLPFIKNIEPNSLEKIDIFYIKNILSFLKFKDLKNISKINKMYLSKMKQIANWLNELNFYSVEKSRTIDNSQTIFIGHKDKYKEYLDLFDKHFKYDFAIFINPVIILPLMEASFFDDWKISLDNRKEEPLKFSEYWDIVINNIDTSNIDAIDFVIHMKKDKYISISLTKLIFKPYLFFLTFSKDLLKGLNFLISNVHGTISSGNASASISKNLNHYDIVDNFLQNLKGNKNLANVFLKIKNVYLQIFLFTEVFSPILSITFESIISEQVNNDDMRKKINDNVRSNNFYKFGIYEWIMFIYWNRDYLKKVIWNNEF